MKNLTIKLNELKINNYNRHDDSFLLNILIDVEGEKDLLKKEFKIGKYDEMTSQIINFIREHVKSKNRGETSNNLIDNLVIIRFKDDLEELEKKMFEFFRRFDTLIRNFKNRGYSENYLMTYKTVDGFSQRF